MENKVINLRAELRPGFERLLSLRKDIGNKHSMLDKYIKTHTIKNMEKAV